MGSSASRLEPSRRMSSSAGGWLADSSTVPSQMRPELGRLVIVPIAGIGALAAILIWEIEHAPSVFLPLLITGIGIAGGIVVARTVRQRIEMLAKHYEGLLRTADEQSRRAEAANRLKDEFLATLSHELRTPLNSVLGWARLLASGKLDAAQTAKAVQAIERAGWAQSRLIEDLLDISQIVAGRLQISPRPILLQPIVDGVIAALHPAATAKQIEVESHLDATIGPVGADPDRLQQIVWNLLSNAIKFTPSGGHVRIRMSKRDHHVCLSVSDTGVGFPAETASHLFERFRQGDSSSTRQYGGLGLGLGIVRHLVEMHGGTVTARSAGPNEGAEFEVLLPLQPVSSYVPE